MTNDDRQRISWADFLAGRYVTFAGRVRMRVEAGVEPDDIREEARRALFDQLGALVDGWLESYIEIERVLLESER